MCIVWFVRFLFDLLWPQLFVSLCLEYTSESVYIHR
jgi:hypothetical protein